MGCDICSQDFNGRRKPLCASCVRVLLYESRIAQASALLDREKAHTHVEAVVRPGNDGIIAALPEDADWDAIGAGVKRHGLERSSAEQDAIEGRINDIAEKAKELREQIESYKQYASKQRGLLEKQRRDLATERGLLEKQQSRIIEPVQLAIRKANQRLDKAHNRTTDARALLCAEAAALSGLRKYKGRDGASEYWLGGLQIPDLRDISKSDAAEPAGSLLYDRDKSPPHQKAHETISASLDNVCRLVCLCSHYLSVRPPAEILLPHNDFPHAMILPEKSSYKLREWPYPRATSSHTSSPSGSRLTERTPLTRPRLLHLDRPLALLLKDDPKAFQLFVEGVMLLAWDVAWLCRTQGIESVNSFEDVCAIGKNLYRLFLNPGPPRPPLDRPSSSATGKERSKGAGPTPIVCLGAFSHGSAHHSLTSPAGLELLRGWKLSSATRLVDKLKSYLHTEISGLEWEFLEEDEWDEERDDEKAVLVGGARLPVDQQGPAMSVMTVAPGDGADESNLDDAARAKGNSGWMKVRGRGGES